jgi:hypothetical protein
MGDDDKALTFRTGLCVYLALGYMTFLYRWKVDGAQP